MKRTTKTNNATKVAFFAGATALMALTNQSFAQSSVDALLNKLEQKGILTVDEAKQLKEENQQDAANDFKKAFDSKITMPDYVSKYKFFGDFRGRYDEVASTDNNPNFVQRNRFRYRLRAGVAVSLKDNLDVGFSLTSADPTGNYGGNPNSSNTTMQDNGSKKGVYIDTAYGKWTPLNDGNWFLSTTIGKMVNPVQFTPMIFDPDWTPEGAALQGGYTFNEHHSIMVTGVAFVEDQEVNGNDLGSVRAPGLFGGQAMWNAKWTEKVETSLGLGGYTLVNPENLTTGNVPYINQGNTRVSTVIPPATIPTGVLAYNYSPIIADASATYKLDSFPLYTGVFPIKVQGEYVNNVAPVSNGNNQGYWVGVTFGKSGKKHTWDISYRYEYLESDAVYDQLADDDNGAYYQNAPTSGAVGYYGGTNIKGHLFKANYSITDALTLSITCYLNQLITPNLNTAGNPPVGEPDNKAMHIMADLMWKF